MQDWTKKNMIFGAVVATIGLTVAEGYGLYTFFKKYNPPKEDK